MSMSTESPETAKKFIWAALIHAIVTNHTATPTLRGDDHNANIGGHVRYKSVHSVAPQFCAPIAGIRSSIFPDGKAKYLVRYILSVLYGLE